MSPANRLIVGIALVLPAVSVIEPSALRKPAAVARTVYVPAGALRLNVPSGLTVTDVTNVFTASYKPTVTGLLADTCPVSVPFVGEGVEVEVAVEVGVGDPAGVDVNVAVGDPVGVGDPSGVDVSVGDAVAVGVNVGVGDPAAVGVNVAVGTLPLIVRLAGDDGTTVSVPSPPETRAAHWIAL